MDTNKQLTLSELTYDTIMGAPQYYLEYLLEHTDPIAEIASFRYGPILALQIAEMDEGGSLGLNRLLGMMPYQYANPIMRFIYIQAIMYSISVDRVADDRVKVQSLLKLVQFTEDKHESDELSMIQIALGQQLARLIQNFGPDYQKIEEAAMLNYAPIVSYTPTAIKKQPILESLQETDTKSVSSMAANMQLIRNKCLELLLNHSEAIIESAKRNFINDGLDDTSFPANIIDLTLVSEECQYEVSYFLFTFAYYKISKLIQLQRNADASNFLDKFNQVYLAITNPATTAVEGVMQALNFTLADETIPVVEDKLTSIFKKWKDFSNFK